jgi:hypothetical protein
MKTKKSRAKCSIKVPTIVHISEDVCSEDSHFVLLEFDTLDEQEASRESVQLSVKLTYCLEVLIGGIVSYIESMIEKYEKTINQKTCEIFHSINHDKNLIKIASFSQANIEDEEYESIEVNLYFEIESNFHYISIGIDGENINYFLSKESAKEIVRYLSEAVNFLKQKPPHLISNFHVGHVLVSNKENKQGKIEMEIEGGIFDSDAPCIALSITENLEQSDFSSTWWISNSETLKLHKFISEALSSLRRNDFREIGSFVENELLSNDKQYPWISISTEQYEQEKFVQVNFDDELVRESESGGIYLLTEVAAEEFSRLLQQSLYLQSQHPPYVYEIPEPASVSIAQIH